MKSSFFPESKNSMGKVLRAQARYLRLKDRADRRLEEARALQREQMAAAEQVEADAWAVLLAAPGVTVATAAAMLQVSEAVVSRWAARAAKQGGAR